MQVKMENKSPQVECVKPRQPTWDHLIEDLNAADSSDPIFHIHNSAKKKVAMDGTEKEVEEKIDTAIEFLKFDEKLGNQFIELENIETRLEIAEQELQEAVERVESQAEMAIAI